MSRKAKLIGIVGDEDGEFSDLVGTSGDLQLHDTDKSSELNWFNPTNNGDTLGLSRKRVTEKDGKVVVSTRLGNKFTFKLL